MDELNFNQNQPQQSFVQPDNFTKPVENSNIHNTFSTPTQTPVIQPMQPVGNVTESTSFTEAVDAAKLNILKEASVNDQKFVQEVKENVKDATVKLAEVEKEKAELEKQNILYHQELKDKERQINEFEKQQNYWENRQKKRQYHYDGVKPIMEFVGIKSPMNLIMLYFLTGVLTPFFLLAKLFKGTIGALIAGAEDSNRPKAMKGFIWTVLGLVVIIAVALCVLIALNWLGIIGTTNIPIINN